MSVYKDSWQKATIEHNIFHNCGRAFSYQHQNGSFGYEGNTGEFLFQNNLIVITDYFAPPSGQAGYSFNGANDYFLYQEYLDHPSEPLQTVKILSNSLVYTQEVYDAAVADGTDMDITVMVNIENHRLGPYIANNVCAGVDVAVDGLRNPPRPFLEAHHHANNLQTNPNGRYPNAWASTDLPDLPNPAVFSHLAGPDSLAVAGGYETAATDGGAIGIRWDSIPTVTELKNGLSSTWYIDHAASSVPDPPVNDYADALFPVDARP
jgi:hypothetical protein